MSLFLAILLAQTCHYGANGLQDPACTSGDFDDSLTVVDLCHGRTLPAIPEAAQQVVLEAYGADRAVIDHLIPACLGGNNSWYNVWPQQVGVHGTRKLERMLCHELCAGHVSLAMARALVMRWDYAAREARWR